MVTLRIPIWLNPIWRSRTKDTDSRNPGHRTRILCRRTESLIHKSHRCAEKISNFRSIAGAVNLFIFNLSFGHLVSKGPRWRASLSICMFYMCLSDEMPLFILDPTLPPKVIWEVFGCGKQTRRMTVKHSPYANADWKYIERILLFVAFVFNSMNRKNQ